MRNWICCQIDQPMRPLPVRPSHSKVYYRQCVLVVVSNKVEKASQSCTTVRVTLYSRTRVEIQLPVTRHSITYSSGTVLVNTRSTGTSTEVLPMCACYGRVSQVERWTDFTETVSKSLITTLKQSSNRCHPKRTRLDLGQILTPVIDLVPKAKHQGETNGPRLG